MIESYWDFYVAYVAKCVRDNRVNDIDPHHYQMEWNHTLPQCLFGDQPLGQYLTLQQHAIASALQTLALRKNCMCGWHKEYLPENLVELAWAYFETQCSDNGKKTAVTNFTPEVCSENGKNTIDSNLLPYCVENGKKTGPENVRNLLPYCVENGKKTGAENGRKTGASNGKKASKCTLVTDIETGDTFEFSSGREAALLLGLDRRALNRVIAGKKKSYKGYTAVYLSPPSC
jgi:hypothetical protein